MKRPWPRPTSLVAALCALASLGAALSTAGSSSAAAGRVRLGPAPALPAQARALGGIAPATRLQVSVALTPRDPQVLAAYAAGVSTPGSSVYHHYLTVSQFADRFGANPATIAAVEASLRAHGLEPGAAAANRLSIPLTATASKLSEALSVPLERYALPGGRVAYANTRAPLVDAGIAGAVQAVVGLDSLAAPRPTAIRPATESPAAESPAAERLATRARPATSPRVLTGGPQPCQAARQDQISSGAVYTADQIASAYRFSGLYAAGDQGAGQTIAVYELEGNFPSDISAYESCYGLGTSVSYQTVDGGPPPPQTAIADGLETELDVEQVIGLAPRANVIVYQGPNSNSGSPGSGPYDTYSTIVLQDRASVITTSWGVCEQQEGAADAQAENTLFQEAATQGQTVLAASGDNGAEACTSVSGTPTGVIAVDDPAGQPYVTGVGGTSLRTPGPPPAETVWNEPYVANQVNGASGGGNSVLWPMPSYQSTASSALGVVNGSSSHACASGSAYCREVPDVAADADPYTGYAVFYNGSWTDVAGTSAAAPLWAALVALANSSGACHGVQLGFVNPRLYRLAGSEYAAAFNDVTSGNNDYTGAGGYGAKAGYDLVTGLGTPNATAVASALCDAVSMSNPNAQTTEVGRSVRIQLHAVSSGGSVIRRWTASGLPAGLSINPSTGLISGTARAATRSTVNVTATDAAGGSASVSFLWTVAAPPTFSGVSLRGVTRRRATLSAQVRQGALGGPLTSVVIRLSGGVGFSRSATRAVAVTSGGRRVAFVAGVAHGVMTLTLAGAPGGVKVVLSARALTVTRALASSVARHRVRTRTVTLSATESARISASRKLKVKV